jgi:hypothetical protein
MLKLFYFQPNLAKLPYELLPLQLHHKNENKNPAYLNEFSSCLEGLGAEKLSSSFVYNFRGGFFLCVVTHILGFTILDTYLSKSFTRLGIYNKQ